MPSTRTSAAAAALARFGRLRPAEKLLVRACAAGDIAKVALRLPDAPSDVVGIRASLLAFILRGGLPFKGRQVQLVGAFIEGRLDLADARIEGGLWLYRCSFDSAVVLEDAQVLGAVTLSGCHLPGVLADRCRVSKGLAINAGSTVLHEVHLAHGRIGGDVDFSGLDLSGASDRVNVRRALLADHLEVAGSLRLGQRFHAVGDVQFTGAQVHGDVHIGGHFNGCLQAGGMRSAALVLDQLRVGGHLTFEPGFGAAGGVRLRRACIGADLGARGANFDWLGDAAWMSGSALALDGARIRGTLDLREQQAPLHGVSLADARATTLADDLTTWGDKLVIDGFDYRRFADGAPLHDQFRIDWLERQEPAHLRAQFRMQPWRQTVRVLRRMGHGHAAQGVALRREVWLGRNGRVGAWAAPGWRWAPRAGHGLLGTLAGHGHRPGRLVAWMAGVWLACGLGYRTALTQGLGPQAAPEVDPFVYSLDRLLPLADLHPPVAWASGGAGAAALRWLGQAEAGFGWLAMVLLLASLAGWMDRDRRG